MKKIFAAIILASPIGFSITSYAFEPEKRCQDMGVPQGMRQVILESLLDLSKEQQDTIHDIRKTHLTNIESARHNSGAKHLFELDPRNSDYDEQVQSFIKDKVQLLEKKILSRSKLQSEIYATLTPGQQDKLQTLRKKMGEKKRQHVRHCPQPL